MKDQLIPQEKMEELFKIIRQWAKTENYPDEKTEKIIQTLRLLIMDEWILAKRITVIFNDDLLKKLHEIQAKQIRQSTKSVSFSRVVNEALRKGLK